MATFYGFNTIDEGRKFRLEDRDLLIRDLLNSLMIRKGEKLHKPNYGTTIWSLLFEGLTDETVDEIEKETQRTIEQDPRMKIENIAIYARDNGILLEISVFFVSIPEAQLLNVFLNPDSNSASLL
jgi:phage baseplate assembly protein W